MKVYRVIIAVVAVGLLLTGKVLAGGAYNIYWDNDASYQANAPAGLFLDADGTQPLSAGTLNTTGDGYLIELVALNGSVNSLIVLKSMTVGDLPGQLLLVQDGFFSAESAIASNVLASAVGLPVGVEFFAGTTTASAHGLVYNNSVTVPSPNWSTPPLGDIVFDLDYSDANYVYDSATTGRTVDSIDYPGWYIIPEPSTMMLVGLGLLGAVGLMRRHRS
jgi:hypothetical protein